MYVVYKPLREEGGRALDISGRAIKTNIQKITRQNNKNSKFVPFSCQNKLIYLLA